MQTGHPFASSFLSQPGLVFLTEGVQMQCLIQEQSDPAFNVPYSGLGGEGRGSCVTCVNLHSFPIQSTWQLG